MKIVVTGIGIQTPLGNELNTLWKNLIAGKSAIKQWDDLAVEGFRYQTACRIENCDTPLFERGKQLAYKSVQAAIQMSRIKPPPNTGIFLGSTMGESAAFEAKANGIAIDVHQHSCASFVDFLQQKLQLKGVKMAFGTACAAGNYAIGHAARQLSNKKIDVAIAGGVDPFSRIAMAGFSRSRAMSSNGFCRPYDQQRAGMILGEGAAFLILEREEDAMARGAKILAKIGALGLSCDAYHSTAPEPKGDGIKRAIQQALLEAKLPPDAISWVCGHGSGTKPSDLAESRAITSVFGEGIPVAAYKGGLGHTLGAATAIEAVICILALQKKQLPPTTLLDKQDENLSIYAVDKTFTHSADFALNCGYAFGGLNSALIIGKA